MLSHRIRPVSEILAPYVEHLWVVRGYLPACWRNSIPPGGAERANGRRRHYRLSAGARSGMRQSLSD